MTGIETESSRRTRPGPRDASSAAGASRGPSDGAGTGAKLRQCPSCGAACIHPVPTPEEIESFYRDGYFEGKDDFFAGRNYFDAREEGIRSGAVTGLEDLARHGSLAGIDHLDVGCASGALLVLTRAAGARVTGVELNRRAAEEGRKRYGLDIRVGELQAAGLPDASQDLVTAIDVLEHFPDPAPFLSEVMRLLRPGGEFFVLTPNFRCHRLLGGRWIGLSENMEHLVYFTPPAFRAAAARSGLEAPELVHPRPAPVGRTGLRILDGRRRGPSRGRIPRSTPGAVCPPGNRPALPDGSRGSHRVRTRAPALGSKENRAMTDRRETERRSSR